MPIWERWLTNQVEHFELIFFSSNRILQPHHFRNPSSRLFPSLLFNTGLQSRLGTHTSARLEPSSYFSKAISHSPYYNLECHCGPSSYFTLSRMNPRISVMLHSSQASRSFNKITNQTVRPLRRYT